MFFWCFWSRRKKADFWRNGWIRCILSMTGAVPKRQCMAETCWGFVPSLAEGRGHCAGLWIATLGRVPEQQTVTCHPQKVKVILLWQWVNDKNLFKMFLTGELVYAGKYFYPLFFLPLLCCIPDFFFFSFNFGSSLEAQAGFQFHVAS